LAEPRRTSIALLSLSLSDSSRVSISFVDISRRITRSRYDYDCNGLVWMTNSPYVVQLPDSLFQTWLSMALRMETTVRIG
jgi:hypothetical protein